MGGAPSGYGLREATAQAAAGAAAALIRALGGLAAHHELSAVAAAKAFADFDEAMALHDAEGDPVDTTDIHREYVEALRARIAHFHVARAQLIGTLEPLRLTSSALIVEAHALSPAGRGLSADVEAAPPGPALEISGEALSRTEHVRVASEAYAWTRRESYLQALLIAKACHLLAHVIDPASTTAAAFAASCQQAEQDTDAFLASVFTPLE